MLPSRGVCLRVSGIHPDSRYDGTVAGETREKSRGILMKLHDGSGRPVEMTPAAVEGAMQEGASVVYAAHETVSIFRHKGGLIVANKWAGRSVTYYDEAATSEAVADFLVRAARFEADRTDAKEVADHKSARSCVSRDDVSQPACAR